MGSSGLTPSGQGNGGAGAAAAAAAAGGGPVNGLGLGMSFYSAFVPQLRSLSLLLYLECAVGLKKDS